MSGVFARSNLDVNLVAEHLQGAASRECDHWHDGAGIMTHHAGFTLELEQSLQSVDARVAVPYWDYTIDAERDGERWEQSVVFSDDWFGAASPANAARRLDWA